MARYSRLSDRQRELVTTGVVRVGVGGDGDGNGDGKSTVETHGTVPGVPLNQFSTDASDGRLRIATAVPSAGDAESANDVYVLDDDLSVEDAARGMCRG